ncbi:MAG: hypothetical protein R2828_18140 [Saprospiraceae bacterium]
MTQSIAGKWQKNAENEYFHFSDEGALKRSLPGYDDSYGIYFFQEGILAIQFVDDPETLIALEIVYQSDYMLTLKVQGTTAQFDLFLQAEHEIDQNYLNAVAEAYGEDIGLASHKGESQPIVPSPSQDAYTFNTPSGKPTVMDYNGPVTIVGTWHYDYPQQPIDFTFTQDGYFYRIMRYMYNGEELTEASHDFGRYTFEHNLLTLHFYKELEKEGPFNLKVVNMKPTEFQILNETNAEGQGSTYENWYRTGDGQMSPIQRETVNNWTIFYRLEGQWESDKEVFKFLDYGLALLHEKGSPDNFVAVFYSVDQGRLQFKRINEDQNFWTAEVQSQDQQKMELLADKVQLTYRFTGQPQLNENQHYFYKEFLRTQHRINLDAIDFMDGTKDWIWVKEKKY